MTHTALTIQGGDHQTLQAPQRPGLGTYAKLAAQTGVCALAAGGLAYSLLHSAQNEVHYSGGHRHLLDDADHGCASNEYYHGVGDHFTQGLKWTGIVSGSLLGSAVLGFGASHLTRRAGHEKAADVVHIATAWLATLGTLSGVATMLMAFNLIGKNKCVPKEPFPGV